ncbi:uncharacterized protein PV09_02556 [Verruconis gallopava]|uniref:Uncharacterized protein n=1 Tax=Verruconis gallopava TaxID=253628 RepID=A0A0D2AJZ0_9PEZI|nr:uncharacterized protein PV09_02556 [Verruconis gallopava]KIW06880.1 hypothetical protein PV09_02556 [Verruconis gallopava]
MSERSIRTSVHLPVNFVLHTARSFILPQFQKHKPQQPSKSMLFKTAVFVLTSALSVAAHPALQQLNARGSDTYTCGNAYDDCQGSGRGEWVCWADDETKTCGKWSGNELEKHWDKPLKDYCKKKAYCCMNDPFVDIDINILGLIDIDIELTLEDRCEGSQIW